MNDDSSQAQQGEEPTVTGDPEQDVIDDPEFLALLTYIEAVAKKVAAELRTEERTVLRRVQKVEPEKPDDPERGTSDYDLLHGIPHYEIE